MIKAIDAELLALIHHGCVIPAHPLALDKNRSLDESYQRALTRYYLESGAGGIAVAVHTTQFEIRLPRYNLLEKVLELAAREVEQAKLTRPFAKVAGIVGPTSQAVEEANLACHYKYDFGLLSNGGLADLTETQLIDRAYKIAEIIPVFGFYLQPAVGGRVLSFDFWKHFSSHPNVHAIKVAAFNRYQTLDVVRAVCESERAGQIALYTGNDDNIVGDLVTPYRFMVRGALIEKRFVGGLLGHWAFGTRRAVELLQEIKHLQAHHLEGILAKGIEITDVNAAAFDPAHQFHGCIAGINEILRRQGLLPTNYCLNESENLSPGQADELDRVHKAYPDLHDDAFIKKNLDRWLA